MVSIKITPLDDGQKGELDARSMFNHLKYHHATWNNWMLENILESEFAEGKYHREKKGNQNYYYININLAKQILRTEDSEKRPVDEILDSIREFEFPQEKKEQPSELEVKNSFDLNGSDIPMSDIPSTLLKIGMSLQKDMLRVDYLEQENKRLLEKIKQLEKTPLQIIPSNSSDPIKLVMDAVRTLVSGLSPDPEQPLVQSTLEYEDDVQIIEEPKISEEQQEVDSVKQWTAKEYAQENNFDIKTERSLGIRSSNLMRKRGLIPGAKKTVSKDKRGYDQPGVSNTYPEEILLEALGAINNEN